MVRRFLIAASIAAISVAAAGCSSKPDKPDDESRKTAKADPGEPLDLDEPTPEELGDSPCGNPDWARPPGAVDEEPDAGGSDAN